LFYAKCVIPGYVTTSRSSKPFDVKATIEVTEVFNVNIKARMQFNDNVSIKSYSVDGVSTFFTPPQQYQ